MTDANPLGRVTLHDPRSLAYEYPKQIVYPKSVRHVMKAPNVDQFYTSGCVGFSGVNMLNCVVAASSRRMFNVATKTRYTNHYLNNDDGLADYSGATKYDPFPGQYPPTDEGSSALGLMKFWKAIGVITLYEWATTFNQFLAALQHQPVLLGTEWFADMMNPDSKGMIMPTGKSVGGHEYLADQLIYPANVIGFENSWGDSWGAGGRFFMHFDDVRRLLANDGDCAVPHFL